MYDERDSKNIPAVTVYDVLDRATLVTLPDGSETATEYATDNSGHALVTTVTDALGNRQASYTNGSGKTLKTEQLSGPDGEITTTFEYDGIQRLVRVTDNYAVRLGVVLALEDTVMQLFAFGLIGFQRIEYRDFKVVVLDYYVEETGLQLIELRFMLLSLLHIFLFSPFLLYLVHLVQPMVMGGFQVVGADILRTADVLV